MTWTNETQPFGSNRAPMLTGLASDGSGKDVPVAVDPATGAILTESSGGGGGGGTSSTFGAAFPTTGTAVGASNGTDMEPLNVDGSGNLKIAGAGSAGTPTGGVVSIQGVSSGTAVPVSGSFYQATQPVSLATNTPTLQSGSTTAVTQGTAANLNATVVGTGTFAVQATQSGTWTLSSPVSGTIVNGQQAVTGTAAALANHTVTQSLTVEALSTNTISVFVGATGVTTSTGIELPAGAAVTLPVSNSNVVFVVASTTGATVTYIGI
jgi:hypothetical protein